MNASSDRRLTLPAAVRIEVAGGIASGKTTFALLGRVAGLAPILEKFRSNPFWRAFYESPSRYAFETEVTFALQHYHQIKVAASLGRSIVCDFSMLLDWSYAGVTLDRRERAAFGSIAGVIERDLGPASLIVYLRCGARTELERIRRRARKEENMITLEYLESLNRAVEARVWRACRKIPILCIDSEHNNFALDRLVRKDVVRELKLAQLSTRIPERRGGR